MDPLKIDTVKLSDAGDALVIIDQTLLPNEVKYLSLTRTEDIWEAIRALRVRGAPAIGVAAAFGGTPYCSQKIRKGVQGGNPIKGFPPSSLQHHTTIFCVWACNFRADR